MKSKTKQNIAKWFAALVVLVMLFQVLLPLFSSGVIGTDILNANVTAKSPAATATKPVTINAPVTAAAKPAPAVTPVTVKTTPQK